MRDPTEDEQRNSVYEKKHIRPFFTLEAVRDDDASAAAGYPVFNEVAHVMILVAGERDAIAKPASDEVIAQYPDDWAAFQKAITNLRAPLRALPGMTPGVLHALEELGARYVDQLVTLDVHPHFAKWRNLAIRYQALRDEAEGKTKPRLRLVNGNVEIMEAA